MKALSIRQPWAWLIVNGYKPVENRSWPTKYRGPVLIHAAKGMTRGEYSEAMAVALRAGMRTYFPRFEEMKRGGIIGQATIVDCVTEHDSPYFFGPYGFVLEDAKPLPFQPVLGKLGFFEFDATGGGQ